MDLAERAECYHKAFPKWPRLLVDGGFILGTWMIGNNYRNATSYYGAYPASYLKRILALFPDVPPRSVLHLFSGSLSQQGVEGTTFDIRPELKPEICGNAEELSRCVPPNSAYLILADPPYSVEDAEHYGRPLVNRNKVVNECWKALRTGGHLVWLDQVFPMYSKEKLKLVGTIGLVRSTNHRVRMVFIWEKIA